MQKTSPSAPGGIPFDPSEIAAARAAVERILASPGFANAARRSQLLKHLVEQALAGGAERITEYGLGVDVFGRPASFDPRLDSIVRTEVSRLRVKLKDYYEDAGREDPVIIEIPPRSYAPSIALRALGTPQTQAPPPAPETPTTAVMPGLRRPPRRPATVWVLAAAIVGAAVIGLLLTARSRTSPPLTSLVVLPFQDYSAGHDAAYLADGITEELTNQFAQDRQLRVVARTSAAAFKNKGIDIREVGRILRAGAALEGSLAREGDTVRITAQLNRTSDGYHLWSHSYVARLRETSAVQAEIEQAVESAVSGRGGPPAETLPDPEAHDHFLQGSFQMSLQTPESLDKSLELFQKAADGDPGYVDAWRGIARAEISRIHFTVDAPRPAFERAHQALARALEIRPGDAETLGQLASIDYIYYWDWPRAEREFREATAHGPRSTTYSYYGWSLATRGRFDEARHEFEMAQELDPLAAGPRYNRAIGLLLERRFGEARRIFQESIDESISVLDAHLMLGVTAVYERNCAAAQKNFDWFAQRLSSPVADFGLALGAACGGNKQLALEYIAKAETAGNGFRSPYQIAMAQAAVGNADAAFAELEKSAEAREGQIFYIRYDPIFDGVRSDPRMAALEKKVGLE